MAVTIHRHTRTALKTLLCLLTASALCASADTPESTSVIAPRFVASPPATEDMLHLQGTRWVIASAVSIGEEAAPGLYAISNDPPHIARLDESAVEPGRVDRRCPTPLRAGDLSPLGLDLRSLGDHWELVVVNRGSRASIERFTLYLENGVPVLRWKDCHPLPSVVSANSVALLESGDLYVTQQFDPNDVDAWIKRVRGEPTGGVYHWSSASGWTPAPVEQLSSPNGLVVADDGCYAFVAAWSARRVVRQALRCSHSAGAEQDLSLALPFMPDNLRWTNAGTVLVTGQDTTPQALLDCVRQGRNCPAQVSVIEFDPTTMTTLRQWQIDSGAALALGTTAEEVGNEIWVSSIPGRLIVRFQPMEHPSISSSPAKASDRHPPSAPIQ